MATVDFSGNIGGVSLYGKGLYGVGLYSRVPPFTPVFTGDFHIPQYEELAGDLAPVVSFAGNLVATWSLVGDLAPSVTFGGDLSLETEFEGDLATNVVLAASGFIAGPLWGVATPCPPPSWEEAAPCPPSLWTPVECDPVDWEDSELCRG